MHEGAGGGGGGSAVRMDPGVAERIRSRFTRHQEALLGVRDDAERVVELLEAGSGEFLTQMSAGSDAFAISWGEALGRGARSAEVIADNVNNFAIDLAHLDTSVVDQRG